MPLVKKRGKVILIAALAALALMGMKICVSDSPWEGLILHVVMKSSVESEARLYYDKGKGLSEKNSVGIPIPGDQQLRDYWFPFPKGIVKPLRFDALSTGGTVTLAALEVADDCGVPLGSVDFHQLKALNQIQSMDLQGGQMRIVTEPNANDPQISVPIEGFPQVQISDRRIALFGLRIIVEYFILLGLFFSIFSFWLHFPNWSMRTLMIVVVIVSLWRGWELYQEATATYLQISLQSSVGGQAQLFFDRGRGFNEVDSTKTAIQGGGRSGVYRFRLPGEPIFNLRFDPFNDSGTVRLQDVQWVDRRGNLLRTFDPHHWKPAYHIRELKIRGKALVVVTEPELKDPQLVMDLSFSLKPSCVKHPVIDIPWIGRLLLEWLVIVAVAVIFRFATRKSQVTAAVWLLDALYLTASLYLFHVYFNNNWGNTVAFVKAWFNG
jgi:hypothetical protein